MPPAYRTVRGFIDRLLRLFFLEIAVEGLERLPKDRGGLFIAGHPNGLIDPALILVSFPGQVIFGARHGLFSWPLVGTLMRKLGVVPIYRASDVAGMPAAEKKAANERSLDALAHELARGSFSALFPEGVSHDDPYLAEVKTGAARLYYRARELRPEGSPPPAIVPVGLHYDRKNVFRSRVLVTFHPPEPLPPELDIDPGADEAAHRAAVKGLTALIEARLTQVTGATEDWETHYLIHRAGRLIRAEMEARAGGQHRDPDLVEARLAYERIWTGFQARRVSAPDRVRDLVGRTTRYDRCLRSLAMEDHELGAAPKVVSPWLVALFLLQVVAVYLLFPPILVVGFLVNAGPYWLLKAITRAVSGARKDEATVKMLGGAILFPLTWALAAVGALFVHHRVREWFPSIPDLPVLVVLTSLALSIVGGWLALVYSELAGETMRALRVRFLRRRRERLVEQLVRERAALCDGLMALGEGLDLPGQRLPDGRLVPPAPSR